MSTPQVNEMVQVILPVATQAELEAAAAVKTSRYVESNNSNIGEAASVGVVITPANALADNKIIRMSKNQKLRMIHQGLIEEAQSWATAPGFQLAPGGSGSKINTTAVAGALTAIAINAAGTGNTPGVYTFNVPGGVSGIIQYTINGAGALAGAITVVKPGAGYTSATGIALANAYKYVAKAGRPLTTIADNSTGYEIVDKGTFQTVTGFKHKDYAGNDVEPFTSYQYQNNWTSSSTSLALVEGVPVLEAEQALEKAVIMDEPGRSGGESMTAENFMSLSGSPVATSATAAAAIAVIDAMRVGGSAAGLTSQMLLDAGILANTIKWTAYPSHVPPQTSRINGYKAGIVAATSPITVTSLQQIVITANA